MCLALRDILLVLIGSSVGVGAYLLMDYWRGCATWPQTRARLGDGVAVLAMVAFALSLGAYLMQ
jgi:hypothetical protein